MDGETYVLIRNNKVIGGPYFSSESAEDCAIEVLNRQVNSNPIIVAKLHTKLDHKTTVSKTVI